MENLKMKFILNLKFMKFKKNIFIYYGPFINLINSDVIMLKKLIISDF